MCVCLRLRVCLQIAHVVAGLRFKCQNTKDLNKLAEALNTHLKITFELNGFSQWKEIVGSRFMDILTSLFRLG